MRPMHLLPRLAAAALGVSLAALALAGDGDGDPAGEPLDADLPPERTILRESSTDPRNRKPDSFRVIRRPQYVENLKARMMNPGEWVIGLELGGRAYAYPVNILNHHEILLDEKAGVPFMVCWCPLCRTGVVHDRTLDEKALEFGHSGRLYRGSFLLYDTATRSMWHHVEGRALTGRMRGRRLKTLPSRFVTWDVWRKTWPDTLVLAKDPTDRDQAVDVYGDRNRSLKLQFGLGIRVGRARRIYEFSQLEKTSLVQETVGGVPVLIFYEPSTGTAVAWDRRFGARDVVLDLRRAADDENGRPLLEETGEGRSTFDPVTGRAVRGPLKGERLRPILASHWEVYAWMAHHPHGTTYRASVPPPVELPPLPDPEDEGDDPPEDPDSEEE